MNPLLKWAGGKRWFVKDFGDDMLEHVMKRGGKYIEPFLGGAAMALHVTSMSAEMLLGDIEEDLMLTYTVVRDDPEELSRILDILKPYTSESAYYRIRDFDKAKLTSGERAARFIYLNKLCFNGLHRKNRKGDFNVPYGKKDKELPSAERIMEVSQALQGAELHVDSFQKLIDRAGKGDVIYADPPYHDTFSNYAKGGFSEGDHEALAECLYNARQRGAEFFCHNADTEKVRYWFGDWTEIVEMPEKRNINSKGSDRGVVPCVLIAGVEDE
jgi:DNA adenine methylase